MSWLFFKIFFSKKLRHNQNHQKFKNNFYPDCESYFHDFFMLIFSRKLVWFHLFRKSYCSLIQGGTISMCFPSCEVLHIHQQVKIHIPVKPYPLSTFCFLNSHYYLITCIFLLTPFYTREPKVSSLLLKTKSQQALCWVWWFWQYFWQYGRCR